MSNLTQAEWIRQYNDDHREQFNPDLFKRDDYEVVAAIEKIILSCQRNSYFTIKVEKFTVVEDYEEIHRILYNHEQQKVKGKKPSEKFENPYQYIDVKDSDIMLLIVDYFISINNPEEPESDRFQVIIKLPRIVNKYYYRLKGNYYYAIFQIVDGSTYNNTSSNSKKQSVTFKTIFMPTRLYRNVYAVEDINGNFLEYITYVARIFNKNVPVVEYFLARYGLYGALRFLGLENVINVTNTFNDNPDCYYFNTRDIYIEVPKYLFDNDLTVQCATMTIYNQAKHKFDKDLDMVYEEKVWGSKSKKDEKEKKISAAYRDIILPDFWLKSIALRFNSKPTVQKGLQILDSLQSIYDISTYDCIRLPEEEKADIYCILRWMLRQFSDLRLKDNAAISTKAVRREDYMAAMYAAKISNGIYRISDAQKTVKIKDIRRWIYTAPDFLIDRIIKDKLVMFRENVNDDDAFNALQFSYKGISGLGEQKGATIPDTYRQVYPSHLGKVDIDTSSASDPGLTGLICPTVKINNGSFADEDYEEIHDWNDTFNNLIKEYIDMKGRKDLISFQSDIGIIEESKAIQQLNEIEATLNSQKAVLEVAKQVDETTEYYDSVETPSGYLVVFDNE